MGKWMPQRAPSDGSHAANEEHRPAMETPLMSSQPDTHQAGQRDDQQVHGNGARGIDQPGRPAVNPQNGSTTTYQTKGEAQKRTQGRTRARLIRWWSARLCTA